MAKLNEFNSCIKPTKEQLEQLRENYWEALSESTDIDNFKDRFFDYCLNDGFNEQMIIDYWENKI